MSAEGIWGTWGIGGVRCRLKRGAKEGHAYGYFGVHGSSRMWVAVLWDGDTAPTAVDASTLMFKHLGGRTFKPESFR